ncbi:hypothetical protein FXO38_27286 [Capsicum annuum]|nr:hypothetical protein FXO38_27286 [Capsicum annuum]
MAEEQASRRTVREVAVPLPMNLTSTIQRSTAEGISSKTARLRSEIVSFKQKPDKNLYYAWECFKVLLRHCPHHQKSNEVSTLQNLINTQFSSMKLGAAQPAATNEHVPIILGRSFLATVEALIYVREGTLKMRVDGEESERPKLNPPFPSMMKVEVKGDVDLESVILRGLSYSLKGCVGLDKVEEKFLRFHARLTQIEWLCFSPEPCISNEHWVHEFYANLSIVSFTKPMLMIPVKQVNLGTERINDMYGLPNLDMKQFHTKSYEPGTWMENILCPGKDIPWATTKGDILMNDFTVKGIFKVPKPNYQLSSPRMYSEDEAPADWSADDAEGDGEESVGEDSS